MRLHTVSILGDGNVIAKIGRVVALSLVEDGVSFSHPSNVKVLPSIV